MVFGTFFGVKRNEAACRWSTLKLTRRIVDSTDIGRHNALDKIYRHCLQNSISLSDKIIVFSGRISSEVLLKVAKIGCGMVLSKSAPSELALRLAEELNITTVGFLRNHSLNIYTRPERIEIQGVQSLP